MHDVSVENYVFCDENVYGDNFSKLVFTLFATEGLHQVTMPVAEVRPVDDPT